MTRRRTRCCRARCVKPGRSDGEKEDHCLGRVSRCACRACYLDRDVAAQGEPAQRLTPLRRAINAGKHLNPLEQGNRAWQGADPNRWRAGGAGYGGGHESGGVQQGVNCAASFYIKCPNRVIQSSQSRDHPNTKESTAPCSNDYRLSCSLPSRLSGRRQPPLRFWARSRIARDP